MVRRSFRPLAVLRLGAPLAVVLGSCRPAPEAGDGGTAATDDTGTETTSPSSDGSESTDASTGGDGFSPDPSWERWEIRSPGYAVPAADTTYVCFGVTFTVTELRHIVAFEPVIDQGAVVHHMLLYRSAEPLESLEPCYPGPPSALTQWGWGPGGEPLMLPEAAGLPVGTQPGLVHYVLQVHYENPGGMEGIVDGSGIDVYTTTELREHDASIFALGDVESLVIPPGQERWPTSFWCGSESTSALLQEPVHVFASWLHAHALGTALWTEQYRDGVQIGELGRHDPYDFGNQRFEPLDATIEAGDQLITRCDYDSSDQTEPTHGGGGTDDEMCLNYLLYYPAQPWLWLCNDG